MERRPYFKQTKGAVLPSPQDKPSEMMLTLFKYIKDLGARGEINKTKTIKLFKNKHRELGTNKYMVEVTFVIRKRNVIL